MLRFYVRIAKVPMLLYTEKTQPGNAIYTPPIGTKTWEELLVILYASPKVE
ncbi:hypothetical protein AGMMS49938_04790 [Fibrobacterales bacterium]|nr:hypothetical protein AGMMS49938_04790 [Fibrobacterales bacterium]